MRQKRLKPTMFRKTTKLAATVLLTVAVTAGCTSGDPAAAPEKSAQEQTTKTVKVQPITKQTIGEPLEQVADVVPIIQMDIIAKASGDIKEIVKKRGDVVQEGDVLIRLDRTDALIQKEKVALQTTSSKQSLDGARKDLENSKAEMANNVKKMEQALLDVTKAYNKAKNSYDEGLIDKMQLDQAENQWKNQTMDLELLKQRQKTLLESDTLSQLEVQVKSSELAMKELDRNLSNFDIKAPVSGILTELPVVEGMTIQAGMKAAHVQQMDPIVIKAQLTEQSAQLVRGKTELVYYVPGSKERPTAPVRYLATTMDTQSNTYDLELEVANPDGALKPGTKVQIQLTTQQEQDVIAVPTLSVVREGGESFVFVLVGNSVEKRKVELGRLNQLVQEVLSGVQEGEKLVISGQNQLKDKETVQLAQAE